MNKNITEFPHLKQLEELVWRQLQETFSQVMKGHSRRDGSPNIRSSRQKMISL